jgi:hypothetical protein
MMGLRNSLGFMREMLVAICESRKSSVIDELSDFFASCGFSSRVCSNILFIDDVEREKEKLLEREAELGDFLVKAEKFKKEKPDFARYWPDSQKEGVIKHAVDTLLAGKVSQFEHFTLIISIVIEAREIIMSKIKQMDVNRFVGDVGK